MWLSHLLLAMTLVSEAGTSPAAVSMPAATGPIVTRQRLFAIPFRTSQIDDPARRPVEMQLYVSGDHGAHWDLYTKVPPAQQHFLFRAAADGEYWFAIRTVDGSGHVWPETITEPGVKVLIDSRSADMRPVVPPAAQPTVVKPEPTVVKAEPTVVKAEPLLPQTRVRIPHADVAAARTDAPTAEPKGSVAIAVNPPVGNKYPDPDDRQGSAVTIPGLPPGERPRMVNSRLFELEYEVERGWPLGHRPGGTVGHPRRRQNLAELRGEPK